MYITSNDVARHYAEKISKYMDPWEVTPEAINDLAYVIEYDPSTAYDILLDLLANQ